jgi:hypothetical protein
MTTEQLVQSKREEILSASTLHVTGGRRAGSALVPMWSMVPIDWPESSGYRLGIYSPSDTPVTASAGVFPFLERR